MLGPGSYAANAMLACLTDETVVSLIEGALDGDSLRHVTEHIDGCAECRRLVAGVVRGIEVSGVHHLDDPGAPAPLVSGTRIGRYVVSKCIGAGAMGVVYIARDPDLGRSVAIKLLRAELSVSPEGRARLLREAQAMAQLSHPNVITIHDVGSHEHGVFLAMEYVDGGTLGDWMRTAPRTWRDVLEKFLAAGEGLAAAHEAGLVHRDFKPDNVLVGKDGRVCVTDFGLARAASLAEDEDPRESPGERPQHLELSMTRTGTLLGTPAYMAPEQPR